MRCLNDRLEQPQYFRITVWCPYTGGMKGRVVYRVSKDNHLFQQFLLNCASWQITVTEVPSPNIQEVGTLIETILGELS